MFKKWRVRRNIRELMKSGPGWFVGESERRATAAKALGELGDPEAVQPLIESLDCFRTEVVRSLAKIGDKRSVEPLITLLRQNWHVRKRTGLAKEMLDRHPVTAIFGGAAGADHLDREVLLFCVDIIEALGEIDDVCAIPALIDAIEVGDKDLVKSATCALRKLTGENFGWVDEWRRWWSENKERLLRDR